MTRLSHRSLLAIPALGLALTACGSPAINTDYTPGPSPTGASASASHSATPHSTKTATSASPKASSHPTTKSSAHPAQPSTGHSTAPSATHSNIGGTHSIKPTAATITVTPSTGLSSGQTVTIHGTHFDPKIKVIAVQCVDQGNTTQANNCDISLVALPKGFYPAADGTFTTTLKVKKTFGGNTCSSATPCLVSVTDPHPQPAIEADAPISFR